MKNTFLLLIVLTITSRCGRTEYSDIEKITIDLNLVKKIQSDYDTFYVDKPKNYDFYKVEIYEKDSSIANLIFKDSLENICAIRMIKDKVDIYVQEFYANGQIKGKTDFVIGKIKGTAKYYYEDGRIKANGEWNNGHRTGTWKWYDETGQLTLKEWLDEDGSLIRKEEMKHNGK